MLNCIIFIGRRIFNIPNPAFFIYEHSFNILLRTICQLNNQMINQKLMTSIIGHSYSSNFINVPHFMEGEQDKV